MRKKIVFFLILIVSMTMSLCAADLQQTLESLSGSAAASYVNPMVSAFGSNMNGGWFHKAPKAKLLGWDLEFGMVVMGTMFVDSDKDFDANGQFNFTQEQAQQLASGYSNMPFYDELVAQLMAQEFTVGIKGPTIVGPAYDDATGENPIEVYFPQQGITFSYNGSSMTQTVPAQTLIIPIGGLLEDIPALPLATPQLTIGTVAGTQLAFRYLPEVELAPEIGKLKYLGYGIQHNPAYWLPFPIPVDVALAFFTQQLDIGDIVETSATTYGLNVSKTWGMKLLSVTPYAGIGGESSQMKFHYDYPTGVDPNNNPAGLDETVKIAFDVDGKNSSRMTLGVSFRAAILNFNFDYNIAKYPSATAGMMFNFSF